MEPPDPDQYEQQRPPLIKDVSILRACYDKLHVVDIDDKTQLIREYEKPPFEKLKSIAFAWEKTFLDKPALGEFRPSIGCIQFEPLPGQICKVVRPILKAFKYLTWHTYGYGGLFKPDLVEVISQISPKFFEDFDDVYVHIAPISYDLNVVIHGMYHLAFTTVFVPLKQE